MSLRHAWVVLAIAGLAGSSARGAPRVGPAIRARNHAELYVVRAMRHLERDNDRYGKWAAFAVKDVVRQLQAGTLEDSLMPVMDALAEHRGDMVGGTKRVFGQSRGGALRTGQGTSDQYRRWGEVLSARTEVTLSTGKRITLTTRHPTDGDFVHTAPEHIHEIIQEATPLYQHALRSDLSLAEVVATVGKLHWWLAHAVPYVRGSAGITDMLSKTILPRHRYRRALP